MPEDAGGTKGVCRIGTLILANAGLLDRQLRDVPEVRLMLGPDRVAGTRSPRNELNETWRRILDRDYAPVFRPALAVLKAIGDGTAAEAPVSELHEAAGRLAQSLGTLGYDYADPLYHRILATAKSDGAFYSRTMGRLAPDGKPRVRGEAAGEPKIGTAKTQGEQLGGRYNAAKGHAGNERDEYQAIAQRIPPMMRPLTPCAAIRIKSRTPPSP